MVDLEEARSAALEVLRYNRDGVVPGLPRTAAWGYPEPYTRDMMIASFGILAQGDEALVESVRAVLEALAQNQSSRGQIPSLANDPGDLGSSDTTPLFLIGLELYRRKSGEPGYLADSARKAFDWLAYQSPDENPLLAQMPTSDWRDEQWVLGYGLYVNALYYIALRLHHRDDEAGRLQKAMQHFDLRSRRMREHIHEGLAIPEKPYYALWAYKMYHNERFDLLGNSLAILSGLVSPGRAAAIIDWVEVECATLRRQGELALDLPPCLFPFAREGDDDWQPRMAVFNRAGEYHNGGIWPFICGFYVAALVAAGRQELAERKLLALVDLVRPARQQAVAFG
ncbi:MAG TPA: glycoside hydrolase 100 family protein, partial [Anaerolineaceae bacterium]